MSTYDPGFDGIVRQAREICAAAPHVAARDCDLDRPLARTFDEISREWRRSVAGFSLDSLEGPLRFQENLLAFSLLKL